MDFPILKIVPLFISYECEATNQVPFELCFSPSPSLIFHEESSSSNSIVVCMRENDLSSIKQMLHFDPLPIVTKLFSS